MARPTKCRRVCRMPAARCFAPDIAGAGQVALTLDELECIRLLDWEGMTQEQCALQMQVPGHGGRYLPEGPAEAGGCPCTRQSPADYRRGGAPL